MEARLGSSKAGNLPASKAMTGTLPVLASSLKAPYESSFKLTCLSCIARIIGLFGKTDIDMTLKTAKTLVGESGVESSDLMIVARSFDCLSTATLALGEAIVPIVPEISTKAVGHLRNIVEEELTEEKLHNAAYGVFGSLLRHLSWIIKGNTLDDLLKVSHGSANAELGPACDQVRQKVLELMAMETDPAECFAALKRTRKNAVIEGPKVMVESTKTLARMY